MFLQPHDTHTTSRSRKMVWLVIGVALAALLAGVDGAAQSPNPFPFIQQPLVPTSTAPSGGAGPGFTLTINGTGFVPPGFGPGSEVYWNGNSRATGFISSNQLTASITASDIAAAGTASVTVVNPTPGGGTSNVAFFHVTNPTTSVSMSKTDYAAGFGPHSVATQDFNGDGMLDLAVADFSDNTVAILLGIGDGTFQTQTTFAAGTGPVSATAGDFNGDGMLDLAVANTNDFTVSILLGNGDGTFLPTVPPSFATGVQPVSVTTGDFNGDGKLDLAFTNLFDSTVSILLGNGDGSFPTHTPFAAGVEPYSVTTGDFNGDGKLDLAVADVSSNTVSILLGIGDGTFPTQTPFATGVYPNSVTTADFNADGKLDLAVANTDDFTVSILLGNGDGSFLPTVPPSFATGANPISVTTGDFNGDDKLDLAVVNDGYNTISILLGNGDGSFQPQTSFATGGGAISAAAGDFNGDGRLDVATANYGFTTVSVLLQTTGPIVQLSTTSLNFGDQLLNTTSLVMQVTLTNNGNAPLTFDVGSFNVQLIRGDDPTGSPDFLENQNCTDTPDLQPGANCTINVFFSPQTTGAKTAVIKIIDNASDSPQYIDLAGNSILPDVTISPSSRAIDFGNVFFGSSAIQYIYVTSSGVGPLIIASVVFSPPSPPGYFMSNGCSGSYPSGNSCTIAVTFTPTATTTFGASIVITDDALVPGSTQTVSLTGVGLPPPIPIFFGVTQLTFSAQNVGTTSAAQKVTLKNTATSTPLTISSITTTGNYVADSSGATGCPLSPATLAALASCTINVTFTPHVVGTDNGTLIVNSDAPSGPLTLPLLGTGLAVPFARGEVFLGVIGAVERRSATGDLIQTMSTGVGGETTGMAFDRNGNLYVTAFSASQVKKFDNTGVLLGNFGTGFASPESIVFDSAGNVFVGNAGSNFILKFDPDGNPLGTFTVTVGPRGTDWIDLAADQCTVFYTSEGTIVRRFDTCTNTQLSDFATGLPQSSWGLRILANGDVLVANTSTVKRLDSSGNIIQTYTPTPSASLLFALNLDPDGTSFWTADIFSTNVYKFDIASGEQILQYDAQASEVAGVAVFGELTAATSPQITLSANSVNFPGNPVGKDCPVKTVTITNDGPSDLIISSLSGITAPFTLNPAGVVTANPSCLVNAPVASGQKCDINFKFLATATGTVNQTLTIASNATSNPDIVQVTGTGTPACALLAKVRSATLLRGTDSQDFDIADAKPSCSPVNLNLSCSVANPAACALNPAVIAPSGSSTLRVSNLKAVAAESLQVLVTSTSEFRAGSELISVRFSDFAFTSAPDSASILAGETATYSVAIRPINGLSGQLSLACGGAPKGATCTVSPASLTLDGSSLAVARVNVTTAARSMAAPPSGTQRTGPDIFARLGGQWLTGLLFFLMLAALPARRRAGLVLAAAMLLVLVWAACGGGGYVSNVGPGGTVPGTYTLTVKGTFADSPSTNSSVLIHEMKLSLKVN